MAVWQGVSAQLGEYKDPETGIVFSAQTIATELTDGGFMWGWALPPDAATVDATEYIGIIVGFESLLLGLQFRTKLTHVQGGRNQHGRRILRDQSWRRHAVCALAYCVA